MNNKLQSVEGKTKLKVLKNLNVNYDQMKYMRQSNTSHFVGVFLSKGAQGKVFIMHEVMLSLKFLQKKLENKDKNVYYYD